MQKIKILYIDDWGDWGGAEKVTLTLLKSINRDRFEPYFILGCDGLFAQALRAERIPVEIIPMKPMSVPTSKKIFLPLFLGLFLVRLVQYTLKTYWVVRRVQPDLIQTCSIQAKIIGSLVAKLVHIKLIWHVQNIQPAGLRRMFVRFMAKRFPDVIVATSHAVARIYADITPSNKLKVIHAGLDKTDFTEIDSISARQLLTAELGETHSKIVIYASMLRRWKGPHILMQAVPQVVKSNPDAIFLFVGEAQFGKDDEFKSQLITLIQKLHLDEYVKLLGFRKDVYNLIAAADCLVHCPIESDPLPNVVLEAMALQTPVIGSSVGGIPEEIENQVTGLVVEPCNHLKLAQAIEQILENPNRAKQLAVAAQHKLESEFSSQLFCQNFETVYSQLVIQAK